MKAVYACEFRSKLRRTQGNGGWVFALIPEEHAPNVSFGWGRTPVRATVDGIAWDTSVWRSKSGITELAIPKRVRGDKDHGDTVTIGLRYPKSYRK